MAKKIKSVDKIYWITIGVVVAISLLIFIIGGVFPFGNNSYGRFDYYYQIIDITSNIFNAIIGRSDLFFSFDFVNGSSFFGNIFYSCISPFNLLIILGGRRGVIYLFPLVVILKFITIACVAMFFIRKYFKNISKVHAIIFTLLYVFSGYVFLVITQPDWIDFLIYLPLVFIAFDYMKRTGKIRYLALTLSLLIITSFSIGSFMAMYALVIFFFYLLLMVEKKDRAKICTKTLLAVTMAVCCTAFITIPCFIEVLHSTRTGNLFESISNMNVFRNGFEKFGYLLPSLLLIIPSIMLVIKNWKKKSGKFYFICLILILIPVLFDNVNVAINFSLYAGYANRIGALYNFIFFVFALIYVNNKAKEKQAQNVEKLQTENANYNQNDLQTTKKANQNNEIPPLYSEKSGKLENGTILNKETNINKLDSSNIEIRRPEHKINVGVVATFALLIFAIILIGIGVYITAGAALITQNFGIRTWLVVGIFYMVIAISFALVWLLKKLRFNKKSLRIMNIVICFVLILCQSVIFLSGNTVQIGDVNNYYEFTSIVTAEDKYSNVAMDLMSGQLNRGWSSMSGFSSLTDKNAVLTYNMLGYSGGGHSIQSNINNIFADLLSGMKYQISTRELDAPYLTEVSRVGNSILYEYNMYLGHAYFVDNLPEFNSECSDDLIYKQNQIYKAITGDNEDIITEIGELEFSVDGEEMSGGLLYDECTASFNYTAQGNELLYIYIWSTTNGTSLNDNQLHTGSNYLTQTTAGEEYSYTFEIEKNTLIYSTRVYTIDFDKLNDFYNTMIDKTVEVDYTKDTITTTTDVLGKYLVINHPSIYGYEYYLNGEQTNVNSFVGFIAYDVENLDNVTVKVAFTYPSVKTSLISLVVGFILAGIILLFSYYFNKLNYKFLNFINICFYILVGALMIYYFIIPFIFAMF